MSKLERAICGLLLLAGCDGAGSTSQGSRDGGTQPPPNSGTGDAGSEADANGPHTMHDGHVQEPGEDAAAPEVDADVVGQDDGSTHGEKYNSGEHCAPGKYVEGGDFRSGLASDQMKQCLGDQWNAAISAGVADNMWLSPTISSIQLSAPLQANADYAASFEIDVTGAAGDAKVELWGTNAECGDGSTAQRLTSYTITSGAQIFCASVKPAASYTHLLMVVRDADDELNSAWSTYFEGATFCTSGTCAP